MARWQTVACTEVTANYPEFSMFGELPAWGFYGRHVNGLTMKNITMQFTEDDFRAAMVFDDTQNLGGLQHPLLVRRGTLMTYRLN